MRSDHGSRRECAPSRRDAGQRGPAGAWRALLLAGMLALAPWQRVAAQSPCASPTPAVCYTDALLQGLLSAHRTSARFETSKSVAFASAASDFMYASYQHQAVLREARQGIEAWTTHPDSNISGSAKSLVEGYGKMLAFQEQTIAMLKADMDGTAEGGMGSMAERLAQLKMLRDSAVYGLGYGVLFATHALVGPPGPSGTHDRLVTTAAERQAFLRLLRGSFPGTISGTKRPRPATDYSEAAKLLRTFLGDPDWKNTVRPPATSATRTP